MTSPPKKPIISLIPGVAPDTIVELLSDDEERECYTVRGNEESYRTTLRNCPVYVWESVQRIQSAIVTASPPGFSPIVSCAVKLGAPTIVGNTYVEQLCDTTYRFEALSEAHSAAEIDELHYEVCFLLFSEFDVRPKSASSTKSRQPRIPEQIWMGSGLCRVNNRTGVKIETLIVLAMMAALREQPETLKRNRNRMEDELSDFFRRIEAKARATAAVLRTFGFLGKD